MFPAVPTTPADLKALGSWACTAKFSSGGRRRCEKRLAPAVLSTQNGNKILRSLLERDLAYNSDADSAPLAEEFPREFLQEFSEGARFFTNGEWHDDNATNGRPVGIWTPATESTFDAGVLVLHDDRVGVYWVEDED